MINEENSQKLLVNLCNSFTPKGFESPIKGLLGKLGFDEIEVTGKSGDGGIDLTATLRRSEIPGIETNIPYKIQAKKFAPDMTLNPRYIRELRGSIKSGERGILITTAKVSRRSIEEEALLDISRLVLVIDGDKLLELCKQYEIAIIKQYEIDKDYLNRLETKERKEIRGLGGLKIIATKFVTENDIRARILRIPKEIKGKIIESNSVVLYFDETSNGTFNIDKTGTYIGGITDLFKKYGLIKLDGTSLPKVSVWAIFKEGFMVKFFETEDVVREINLAGS
jgi:restriction system protein